MDQEDILNKKEIITSSDFSCSTEVKFTFNEHRASRLDKIIYAHLESNVSREKIKKLILAGHCYLEQNICTEPAQKISQGQSINLFVPEENTKLQAEDGELDILYQDEYIIVLNKPANLTVHPAPSCLQNTLVQRLLTICPELHKHEGWRPGIVHRLDKDTSGLIIIAPHEQARLALSESFAAREVKKTYLALVHGIIAPTGECHLTLGRHPTQKTKMAVVPNGRTAFTQWERVYYNVAKNFSLVKVRIHTGRTHQIRVHLAELGHPVLGDSVYGNRHSSSLAPRQMLHALSLSFKHPISNKELKFKAPIPEDFLYCLGESEYMIPKIIITGLAGCGKSRFTQALGEQGLPVWSADEAVKKAYEYNQHGWQILHHRFQGKFTPFKQAVDKVLLGEAMRLERGLREEVEHLIHPVIIEDLTNFFKTHEKSLRLAAAEVPLWFEMKNKPKLEPLYVVGVHCPVQLRHQRLQENRNWEIEQIAAADSWQLGEEAKLAKCNHVIDNSKDLEHLLRQTKDFVKQVSKLIQIQHQKKLDNILNKLDSGLNDE